MNIFSRIIQSAKDVYDNRVILLAMTRRNTAGRYKSTYVGFIWHRGNDVPAIPHIHRQLRIYGM